MTEKMHMFVFIAGLAVLNYIFLRGVSIISKKKFISQYRRLIKKTNQDFDNSLDKHRVG